MKSFVSSVQHSLPDNRLDFFGKGGLLMTSKPYYILLAIIALAYCTIWTHAWLTMIIIYAILPLLDEVCTLDQVNPTEAQRKQLEQDDIYFKLCLYLTIIADWFLFFKFMAYFTTFTLTFQNIFNFIALIFVFSNLNAVQFTVAHEIFHKPGLFNRVLGTLHMSKNLYMHFTYQHIYGHHRRVATPEDPASAQYGITLYQYLPRTVIGSYKSVYKMQKEAGKPFLLNYSVLSIVSAVLFTAVVFYFYGPQATFIFLLEAIFSIVYLEGINYVEHYGLSRKKLENGEYEKVTIRHSWNSPHRFSNYILYKLQRHSDHHQNALKPYQTLVSLNESPHLPQGYSLMIIMTFFPKVWFSIMNPLVDEYKKVGMGTVENEVTQKAIDLTKQFSIRLGTTVTVLFLASFLL